MTTSTARNPYKRTVAELHEKAAIFWPYELSQQEAEKSIIPKLIETQDQFIAILSVDVPSHNELFQIINSSKLSASLFLKHLMVLADVGAEKLEKFNREWELLFPNGEIKYIRGEKVFSYKFRSLPTVSQVNSKKLKVTGKDLLQKVELDDLTKDVIVLLTFGSSCEDEDTAERLVKCEVGNYIGDYDKLSTFVRQRYIWVSRITGGAQANTLGQIAQHFVRDYLQARLPNLDFSKQRIPGITHSDTGRPTSFDIVVTDGKKYVAIEVSFQVTTNSTIERKAGQARSRFEQIERLGYKMAYVIDGSGNFQRQNAAETISTFSHCNVAFTHDELDVLVNFIREYFQS